MFATDPADRRLAAAIDRARGGDADAIRVLYARYRRPVRCCVERILRDGACLHEALAALPADQRQVVLMRHVVGLTTLEIAAALGRAEGSVHALHHRGRAGLRRRLGELGVAPAIHS